MVAHGPAGHACVALLILWFPLLAQAVTVVVPPSVGAGASQRRNHEARQRLRSELTPAGPSGPVLIGPPGTPGVPQVAAGGPRFVLHRIVITPSHFLAQAELDRLASDYLDRPVTLADLYRLVARINALYARRGLITDRAFLPPQRVTHGRVTIDLVEGRLGRIDWRGRSYTARTYILDRLPLQPGQVVDAPALQQALEYFNRTNSNIGLRAQLRPGGRFGLSDILLDVLEPPRRQFNLLANNDGDASTGRVQGGFYAVLNGPLHRGGSLSLYYLASHGAYNYDAQYNVPLSVSGLKLSLSASHDHIRIIAGPYEALGIEGAGDQQNVTLTQPLVANGRWLFSLGASLAHAQSHTTLGGFELSGTRSWQPGLGASVEYTPRRQSWSGSLTVAQPMVKEAYGPAIRYWLFNATLDGRVVLSDPAWSLGLRSVLQFSPVKSMTSSQLFQLGGAGSVLGYPSGAAAGVSGYFAELALHRRLPRGLRGQLFYAQGSVYTPAQPSLKLESAGAGIAATLPGRGYLGRSDWSFKLARPLRTVLPHQAGWIAYFSTVVPLNF